MRRSVHIMTAKAEHYFMGQSHKYTPEGKPELVQPNIKVSNAGLPRLPHPSHRDRFSVCE